MTKPRQQDGASGGRATKDTKKALAKAMKKKEKAERRIQIEREREMRKAREERRLEEERKKDEERARKKEEEEQRERELEDERRRKEEEEYAKWEKYITLEGEGVDVKEDLFDNEERLEQFVHTIVSRKVTVLDEIAVEFDMSVQVTFIPSLSYLGCHRSN